MRIVPHPIRSFLAVLLTSLPQVVWSQAYGTPDRDQPGDAMMQAYLAAQADQLHATFLEGVTSAEQWQKLRQRYTEEYSYMLGLWPLPPRTPLKATITRSMAGEGFAVDMLHYQSKPRLYVTGNLYRPPEIKAGERLPAVFYVCGHSGRGRNGNKTAYQSHGIWFARHGYVCLVVDSLQLGEIAAIHHGTYRYNRWWWHSRGYTPAGVECWNGIRGIDYLISRPDVDPDRIAVTGISGGGAATFWIAAADERVRVAVPVSGMADLPSYVTNRVINGHCDCMFLYNTFQWPWTRIAALIAPRAFFFVNSDKDRIFPMDANDRIINRLERLYSFFGAGDMVDCMVSVGGHAYREDIRRGAYRFINTYLQNDPRPVTDSEVDLVSRVDGKPVYPIPLERLRVFPEDPDIPADELNTTIDRHFVPLAQVEPPGEGAFPAWKEKIMNELRRVTFRSFPMKPKPATVVERRADGTMVLQSEPGVRFTLQKAPGSAEQPKRVCLAVVTAEEAGAVPAWLGPYVGGECAAYLCQPRGIGDTRWTRKNPPNYIERSHVLLGRTVAAGRIRDIAAAAAFLRDQVMPVRVAGSGSRGILAAYAALLDDTITEVHLDNPPVSHMEASAPPLLNVLRVCDIPHVIGMLAPRRIKIEKAPAELLTRIRAIYRAAGCGCLALPHRSAG